MKTYAIPNTTLQATRLGYGCMKLGGNWTNEPMMREDKRVATQAVASALEHQINFFDHADIYCRGKSESAFGEIMDELKIARDSIILQSKCGIWLRDDPTPGAIPRFDFSYEHITSAVEGSLRRLKTDYLDILLLHRPDALVEPAEVARAFDELHTAGKVRYFGVSNHTPEQIRLLKKYVKQPIVVNQVELNLLHADLITDGMYFNIAGMPYTVSSGTLEYCRAENILLQAWAPVANGRMLTPTGKATDAEKRTAAMIKEMAKAKNTSLEAIALAWLLRHPAPIQPILGTTKPERIAASVLADDIELTRLEWYEMLKTARGQTVP